MKNIETILSEAGIQLNDEQRAAITAAVAANYKTVADYNKQAGKYSDLKAQYDGVKASLDKFDGVDLEGLQKQIADAQEAARTAEENAKKQMAARDYSDAVKEAVSSLKFSSTAAQKQFISDLTETNLPIKDGHLLGLNDYIAAYKAADAGAILDAQAEEKKATFTQPEQPQASAPTQRSSEYERRLAEVMGVKKE